MKSREPPLRVAWFTDTLGDVNGVSRFVRNMARQADSRECAVTVMTSTRLPVPDLTTIANFEPVFADAMPKYEQLEMVIPPVIRMLRHVERFRPDVIHVSTPGPVGLVGLYAAKRVVRVPLIGTYHTDFPAYIDHLFDDATLAAVCAGYMKWFYRRCARVISRSPAFIDPMRRIGIEADRMETLRSGIDHDDFGPGFRDDDVWRPLGLAHAESPPVRALYVGRVSVEKNLPLLTRVWERVHAQTRAEDLRAELIVVGDGPYLAEMRACLAGKGAHFLGFRHGKELASIYASADFFLFPSLTDTLGQSVMEAHASGLPAIVSDKGGPATIVRDHATGRILPGDDERSWVQATLAIIRDPHTRKTWSAAAIDSIRGRDIGASFDHFWEICHEVRRCNIVGYRAAPHAIHESSSTQRHRGTEMELV